jgi:chromosome partitioning protein
MNLIFINEKGGTGKTTISFNIAVEFQRNKYNVILTDADRQESLTSINNLREKNKFTIRNIETIEKNNDKNIINIIDTGGRDSTEMRKALLIADFVFIITNVSQLDLFSIERIKNLLIKAKDYNNFQEYYILNRIPPNPFLTRETKDFINFCMSEYSINFLEEALCERVAYKRSIQDGQSASELNADPKATAEIRKLYNNIISIIK